MIGIFEARAQSRNEEAANSVSHGLALLAALIASPFLVAMSIHGGGLKVAGSITFTTAVICLYLASAFYHAWPEGQLKQTLKKLDHCAIYLLIAGSYTPFALVALHEIKLWLFLGLVWGLAIIGIVLKLRGRLTHAGASLALYLTMGWLALLMIEPLWLSVSGWGMFWLIAGGVSYPLGSIFYAAEQISFGHFVWHLFTVLGTACHFVAAFLVSA